MIRHDRKPIMAKVPIERRPPIEAVTMPPKPMSVVMVVRAAARPVEFIISGILALGKSCA